MNIILYNPKTNSNNGLKSLKKIKRYFSKKKEAFNSIDITTIDTKSFLLNEDPDNDIILLGGDGTLHTFANDIRGIELIHKLYFYRCGTGNDFSRSIKQKKDLVLINPYLKNLPVVKVLGREETFINGCGLGLDGLVCNYVEEKKLRNGKGQFFRSTIKGFKKYSPIQAKVIIDGVEHLFKKVFLVSIMNSTYYGGGMKIAPFARRDDAEFDVCVIHHINKFLLLFLFPLIYFGKHLLKKKSVFYAKGLNIKVIFENKTFMQLDGEVIKNVNEIEVFY